MRLSHLLSGIDVRAASSKADPEIRAIVCDSRQVRDGALFVCLPGERFDGHDFARDAVMRGAAAVLAERPVEVGGAPLFLVPSARKALAELALRWEGNPERELRLAGVTGTNGKTTTTFLLASILEAAGEKAGILGTVGTFVGGERIANTGLTTPGPLELAAELRRIVDRGCTCAAMEVSSHALEQERVAGLRFAAAAFTNLSRDHLDYHGTMEAYFAAKSRLFSERLAEEGVAVVNADDPWASRVGAPRVLRFSLRDRAADIFAHELRISMEGIRMEVKTPSGPLTIRSSLVGEHNAENLLCAVGLALALGVKRQAIEQGLERSAGAPGRLERIEGKGVTVFVDYAHTDAALAAAIRTLRRLGPARLSVVFGCGGDRDRGKRAPMGEAAAMADRVIVTSDNPRSEDPEAIIREILVGIRRTHHPDVTVEPDRRRAIELAIEGAVPGEAVLIAGKGHEDYQIVGTERRHFDDREEARRVLAELSRR
ncbi:MAG: UDP-N-acetylmuramoyl-L-alanyl-D-glutamate--2,6-diaminopimelate ligase [Pseudomonadota bacterium]|nr:MAG: UDP-N-acetylmuramoyl-L-alanyl-D-glutamate--2,6-diaminopimelate ligase [Pseudomonadota bacterium]